MHHLADKVIAEVALVLVLAELPSVRSRIVSRCDNPANVTRAVFTGHGAMFVEKIAHGIPCLVGVGEGVKRNPHQEILEVVKHDVVEAVPLEHHGDGLAVLETS